MHDMTKDPYQNTIRVYEKLGKGYLENRKRFVHLPEMKEFFTLLPQHARVLDVGCAGGRDAKLFADEGHDVVGIDMVDVFLEEARAYVPNAQFHKMDVRHMDFPPASFDAIWANAVLLHFHRNDVPGMLGSFFAFLKPGGVVHVRVKEGEGEKMTKDLLSEQDERFFTYFAQEEMGVMLQRAGFAIMKSRIFPDEFPDGLNRKGLNWISIWGKKPE